METKTKMKEYHTRNPYSEKGIAGMIGMPQSIFSTVKNGNFHRNPDANEAKMEKWLVNFGYPMEKICERLKELTTDNYGNTMPDGLVITRMKLHSKRAKLMRGITIETNKTGMRQTTTKAAPLQS